MPGSVLTYTMGGTAGNFVGFWQGLPPDGPPDAGGTEPKPTVASPPPYVALDVVSLWTELPDAAVASSSSIRRSMSSFLTAMKVPECRRMKWAFKSALSGLTTGDIPCSERPWVLTRAIA